MADRIIIVLSSLLCSGAFFLIGYLCSVSTTPVPFWTGSEQKLQNRVKDILGFNRTLGRAFRRFGLAWLLDAALGAAFPPAGLTGIGILCTLGLYLLYRTYRNALSNDL